jgi:hypothetical protein
MQRKAGNQQLCGRRHCSNQFRAPKSHFLLGRYQTPGRVNLASEAPIKIGFCERLKTDRPCRIVAGPALTPGQLRLATVRAAFGACSFDLDRTLNGRHWHEAERAEIEAGEFTDTYAERVQLCRAA